MNEQTFLDQLKEAEDAADQLDVLHVMAQPPAEMPEQGTLDRVAALFRQRMQAVKRTVEETFSAELRFDSLETQLALGMRGSGPQQRQLLFEHDAYHVDLNIIQDEPDGLATIHGQLMSLDSADLIGIEAQLTLPDSSTMHRISDNVGLFTFSNCPAGAYQLTIVLNSRQFQSTFTIENER